jgi:hypothetical protein
MLSLCRGGFTNILNLKDRGELARTGFGLFNCLN